MVSRIISAVHSSFNINYGIATFTAAAKAKATSNTAVVGIARNDVAAVIGSILLAIHFAALF